MAKPTSVTMTLTAADDDCIFLSADPGNNASLTLNGAAVTAGVAILDIARRVVITSAADDRAKSFVVAGTDRYGNVISETIVGANATAAVSVRDYKTVTSVTCVGNPGTIIIGTNTKASSAWIPVNHRARTFTLGIGTALTVGASLNYDVEHTYDDIQDPAVAFGSNVVTAFSSGTITNKTANFDGSYTVPIRAWRLTLNTWASGSATSTGIQAGH